MICGDSLVCLPRCRPSLDPMIVFVPETLLTDFNSLCTHTHGFRTVMASRSEVIYWLSVRCMIFFFFSMYQIVFRCIYQCNIINVHHGIKIARFSLPSYITLTLTGKLWAIISAKAKDIGPNHVHRLLDGFHPLIQSFNMSY